MNSVLQENIPFSKFYVPVMFYDVITRMPFIFHKFFTFEIRVSNLKLSLCESPHCTLFRFIDRDSGTLLYSTLVREGVKNIERGEGHSVFRGGQDHFQIFCFLGGGQSFLFYLGGWGRS